MVHDASCLRLAMQVHMVDVSNNSLTGLLPPAWSNLSQVLPRDLPMPSARSMLLIASLAACLHPVMRMATLMHMGSGTQPCTLMHIGIGIKP